MSHMTSMGLLPLKRPITKNATPRHTDRKPSIPSILNIIGKAMYATPNSIKIIFNILIFINPRPRKF